MCFEILSYYYVKKTLDFPERLRSSEKKAIDMNRWMLPLKVEDVLARHKDEQIRHTSKRALFMSKRQLKTRKKLKVMVTSSSPV